MEIPILSDKLGRRRPFLLIAAVAGIVLTYPVLASPNIAWVMLCAGLLGFLLLAGYPLLIARAEEVVHGSQAAKAVSILMLMGNLGGVLVVLGMEAVKNMTHTWHSAIYVLIGMMMVGLPLLMQVRDRTAPVQSGA